MKNEEVIVRVASVIESDAALTPTAGDKVFAQLHASLSANQLTHIDFDRIRFITSAFLNAAIGQLYAHYSSDFLKLHLKTKNISQNDIVLLARVVERAKEYFSDKESLHSAIKNVLND